MSVNNISRNYDIPHKHLQLAHHHHQHRQQRVYQMHTKFSIVYSFRWIVVIINTRINNMCLWTYNF